MCSFPVHLLMSPLSLPPISLTPSLHLSLSLPPLSLFLPSSSVSQFLSYLPTPFLPLIPLPVPPSVSLSFSPCPSHLLPLPPSAPISLPLPLSLPPPLSPPPPSLSQLVDGGNDPLQTHPELVSEGGGASFDITGEFWTHSPLPEIRYTLRRETKGLFSDDRIIARVTLVITTQSHSMYNVTCVYTCTCIWCKMYNCTCAN